MARKYNLVDLNYKDGEFFSYDVDPSLNFVKVFEEKIGEKMQQLGNPDSEEGMFRTHTTQFGVMINYTEYTDSNKKRVGTLDFIYPRGIPEQLMIKPNQLEEILEIKFGEQIN